jgi:hypothetical protein
MTQLREELQRTLLPGMHIPKPIDLLYSWIESNGLITETEDGRRIGNLCPQDELRDGWTDRERLGGTMMEFFAEGNVTLKYWFGHEKPDVLNRLCIFARTGAEGSRAAFWLDNKGNQKIVHLGSGSGSTLVCVLADEPLDFLRLIAIGYDEICWSEKFAKPPNADYHNDNVYVHPNLEYQNWVRHTFSVTIPQTASEIVRNPSHMDDRNSEDPFWQWVEQNT